MEEKKSYESNTDKYYIRDQKCPNCGKDDFLELKQFPGHGRCAECSFDTEIDVLDKIKDI